MANPDRARHDVNHDPTVTAVSNADGEAPVSLWADPTSHALVISGVVSVTNAEPAADATGTFTNATQTTSVTTVSLSGYEAATLSINGVYAVATAVFEGSDDGGVTWYGLQGARTDSGVVENGYTTLTNTIRMWTFQITGLDTFRVRSTAVTSGTVTVRISISSAPTSDASVVSVGTALPTGSNVIGAVTGSATGAAVPAGGFYLGIASAGNLHGVGATGDLADANTGVASIQSSAIIYNGTTYDRTRSVQGVADTVAGVGLAAIGGYVYNGASWEKMRGDLGDASAATGLLVNNALLYNGATYDRQRGDTTSGEWVNIKNGLMPAGTVLTTYSIHLTTNTTTTPTASTAYISSVSISNEVGGTTSTVTIQDKQGTPLKLINGLATTALTTAPTVVNFQTPVKMVSGIDVITAGAVAATVDVWINYYA